MKRFAVHARIFEYEAPGCLERRFSTITVNAFNHAEATESAETFFLNEPWVVRVAVEDVYEVDHVKGYALVDADSIEGVMA